MHLSIIFLCLVSSILMDQSQFQPNHKRTTYTFIGWRGKKLSGAQPEDYPNPKRVSYISKGWRGKKLSGAQPENVPNHKRGEYTFIGWRSKKLSGAQPEDHEYDEYAQLSDDTRNKKLSSSYKLSKYDDDDYNGDDDNIQPPKSMKKKMCIFSKVEEYCIGDGTSVSR